MSIILVENEVLADQRVDLLIKIEHLEEDQIELGLSKAAYTTAEFTEAMDLIEQELLQLRDQVCNIEAALWGISEKGC